MYPSEMNGYGTDSTRLVLIGKHMICFNIKTEKEATFIVWYF